MGKKKTKTTSSSTERATVTPTNPQWVTDSVQGLSARVGQLGQVDPYSLVAPLHGLEQQAMRGAANLDGYGSAYDEAADWTRGLMAQEAPSVQSASLLDGIEAYYNPYRSQVVDAATADFDADAGRTRASQTLSLAGQGAFGGSGAALTRSLTEGELARARNTQVSNLLAGMFSTSADLASQDAERRQQASIQNAQLAAQTAALRLQAANSLAGFAGSRAASDREDLATQAALGAQARGVDQAYRLAPYTALNSQADIMAKLPLELFRGSTTEGTSNTTGTRTDTPSFLDNLGQATKIAGDIFSLGTAMFPPKGVT
ncbi:hypothetical protein [Phenylobacterium sp.]|uniref:hypothetical protein n=1 Tax=Phenylobacterium sp. TaxID=1871053 RepID=UPI00272FF95C|nr:hypothetical protein [Phenylobacterium sp.]MDP1616775.1 hypothetical protein [Phenylobacterium sp.]MDP1988279.1 hypothetical protein [Phenylobacterium sp.]